ncbi:MAG: hypothetical protein MJZ81_06275 [Bacteroidales bacterium]|nr:hypothetical protein [Bacteroidales bacterium]
MTTRQYNYLLEDFSRFANTEVKFKSYVPSLGDFTTKHGRLIGIGTRHNANHLIIGWMGSRLAIHYSQVSLRFNA